MGFIHVLSPLTPSLKRTSPYNPGARVASEKLAISVKNHLTKTHFTLGEVDASLKDIGGEEIPNNSLKGSS